MYELYKCKKILRLHQKKSILFTNKLITIVNSIHREINGTIFLILITSNYQLILFSFDRNFNQNSLGPKKLIKSIPLDEKKGKVKDICFDNDNQFLFLAQENGSIFKIPIFEIAKEMLQGNLPKIDGSILINEKLPNLNSIVFWKNDKSKQEIIISGSTNGIVTFFDCSTQTILKKFETKIEITRLSLIIDNFSTSLIISSQNGCYYRIILEEHLQSNDISFVKICENVQYNFNPTIESNLNHCFNHFFNFKPSILDLSFDGSFEQSQIFFDSNFFMNLVSWPQKNFQHFRVYPWSEFDFSYNSPIIYLIKESSFINCVILTERFIVYSNFSSCYILSKEMSEVSKNISSSNLLQNFEFDGQKIIAIYKLLKKDKSEILDSFLIVTSEGVYNLIPFYKTQDFLVTKIIDSKCLSTTLNEISNLTSFLNLNFNCILEKVAQFYLKKNQVQKAFSFYELAKSSPSRCLIDLVRHHYFSETVDYIEKIFVTKLHELDSKNRIYFSHVAVKCYLRLILDNKLNHDIIVTKTESLKNLLRYNQWYDEHEIIKLFIKFNFYDLSLFCAQVRCSYSALIFELLKNDHCHLQNLKDSIEESASKNSYFQFIQSVSFSLSYYKVLTSSHLILGLLEKPFFTGKYLRHLIKLLPNLDLNLLKNIAKSFDPRQINTHFLIHRSLPQLKHQYLVECDINEEMVQKKDLINFFILVLLIIFRHKKLNYFFDDCLLNLSRFQPSLKSVSETKEWKNISISAGRIHCALVKNGLLYTWGKPDFGVLGRPNASFETNPKLTPFFSETLALSVRQVSCGAIHTLVLTDYGCFAFGSSKYGQLGLGPLVEQTYHPIFIETLANENITSIYCGQYHSLAISSEGNLFSWGWGVHGQLGHDSVENLALPKQIQALKKKFIKAACGGYFHSLALDSNGVVYSWGNGEFGQLGFGNKNKHSTPKPLFCFDQKIQLISCSYFHNLAVTEAPQKLYSWGCNPYQISIAINNIVKKNQKFQNQSDQSQQYSTHMSPQLVKTTLEKKEKIVKISTGVTHSAFLTSHGKIYTWDQGGLSQLSHSSRKEILEPTMVVQLADYNLVDIETGLDFTLTIDKNGNLWGFGQNHGILDLNLNDSSQSKVINSKNDRKISLKNNHRFFSYFSQVQQSESSPMKISFTSIQKKYLQKGINSSIDFNTVQLDDQDNFDNSEGGNKKCFLTSQSNLVHDQTTLASIIFLNLSDLDLDSILSRCLSFDNYQCAAIVYELKGMYQLAMEAQLKALSIAYQFNSSLNMIQKLKVIFYSYISKFLTHTSEVKSLIKTFIEFWINSKLDQDKLEKVILESFQTHISGFTFGVIFFQFLDDYKNVYTFNFTNFFILNFLSITLEKMDKTESQELNSMEIINLMSSGNDGHFPLEVIWQNILQNLQKTAPVRKQEVTSLTSTADFEINHEDQILHDVSKKSILQRF